MITCLFSKPEEKADISFIAPVGNDARKVVMDGYPMENVVTSDLYQGPFLHFRDHCCVFGSCSDHSVEHSLLARCRIREPRAQALQDDARDVPDGVRPG